MLSFLAHNDVDKPVIGLREAAPDSKDRPPVNLASLREELTGLEFLIAREIERNVVTA